MTALVAVLAGGRGRRMGAPKPLVELGGRPLVTWPLAAAAAAGLPAAVVVKADTPLPPGLGVPVWLEPAEPVHPLLGVVTALERAGGPVVAVACDMPFVPADLLARLAEGPGAAAVTAGPFPARYEPAALGALRAALARGASLRATLTALRPEVLEVPSGAVAGINTREELEAARRRIGSPG